MSITSHLTSRITSSLTSLINLAKELPRLVLSINNIGVVDDANGGKLINGRTSTQTVIDYTGKVIDCLANEIRYRGARRVDHADSIIYNAGVAGIEYFDTEADGTTKISPRPTLMHEPAYTNQITQSENFPSWLSVEIASLSQTETSPRGDTTAWKLIPSTNSAMHLLLRDSAVTVGKKYTFSIFFVNNGYDFIQIATSTGFELLNTWANYNGATSSVGTLGPDPESLSARIVNYGAFSRCILTAECTTTMLGRFVVFLGSTDSASRGEVFAGDGVKGHTLWGAQFVEGTEPLSYAKTTASVANVATDNTNIPTAIGTNFNQEEGAALIRFIPKYDAADQANNEGLVSINGTAVSLLSADTSVASTNDGTNSPSVAAAWTSGNTVIASSVWSSAENKLTISSSVDGGVTWATWIETAYDDAFVTTGLFELFKGLLHTSDLELFNVYSSLESRTVLGMQNWIEDNAGGL